MPSINEKLRAEREADPMWQAGLTRSTRYALRRAGLNSLDEVRDAFSKGRLKLFNIGVTLDGDVIDGIGHVGVTKIRVVVGVPPKHTSRPPVPGEWISVAERLPEKGKFVLTCRGRRRELPMILRIRYLHQGGGRGRRSAYDDGPVWADEHGDTLGFDVPTHWMAMSEPQWQSIETAPKTGEWILLGYFPEAGGASQLVAFWHETKRRWCDVHTLYNAEGYFSPTHWRVLPDPPAAQPEPPK